MNDVAQRLTVPDLALRCLDGTQVNPADLRGQNLVIFFCPRDPSAAALEIEEFSGLAARFVDAGVWLLGVLQGPLPPRLAKERYPHIELAEDLDGRAWAWLEPALRGHGTPDRSAGAAFFFERCGSLRKAWPSSGHARDVLGAATSWADRADR